MSHMELAQQPVLEKNPASNRDGDWKIVFDCHGCHALCPPVNTGHDWENGLTSDWTVSPTSSQ